MGFREDGPKKGHLQWAAFLWGKIPCQCQRSEGKKARLSRVDWKETYCNMLYYNIQYLMHGLATEGVHTQTQARNVCSVEEKNTDGVYDRAKAFVLFMNIPHC